MIERPIIFSGPMVRAILEGRKTVTRRAVKGGQVPAIDPCAPVDGMRWSAIGQRHLRYGFCVFGSTEEECARELGLFGICPYGKPGDHLWVREAWSADAQVDAVAPRDLSQGEPIMYPADGAIRQTGCAMISQGKGRPSIHMPRWASRILLEITAVRVERLQDISEEQILAEGLVRVTKDGVLFKHGIPERDGLPGTADSAWPWQEWEADPHKAFAKLWSGINGAESWAANPWVWVVEFKRVTP